MGCCRIGAPMMHGWANFDTGRKAVEDQTANLTLKNGDQFAVGFEIRLCSMDGGCQLSLHGLSSLFQLFGGYSLEEY